MKMTTLCYIEKDGKYLMLHRTKKEKDINKDKWIGVGGHAEEGEGPEECLLREVSDQCEPELMCLFSADKFEGEVIECDEGDLFWVEKEKVPSLPTWEGDAIFLKLFLENEPRFFSLRLVYEGEKLVEKNLRLYES